MTPFISICIPAYKNPSYLIRLLDSIKIQTYRHFEVILTDDSPDDVLSEICNHYLPYFTLKYFKNKENLNTPENWNESVKLASFEWIKIMHDDDWFAGEDSLSLFADAIVAHSGANFFFSAYTNIYEGTSKLKLMRLSTIWKKILRLNVESLISRNVVGPPSVTLYLKTALNYDRSMKYVVDIDFYTEYLKTATWFYIDSNLINVGINPSQVTKYTFGVPEVQLKESLFMLEKKSNQIFFNIFVFDGWWRLIRNFNIKQISSLSDIGYNGDVQNGLSFIIGVQNNIPGGFNRIGVFSKIFMFISYCLYRIRSRIYF